MTVSERYVGKPFLRLLECYVLRAIGELSNDEESKLETMSPKLREVYKFDGSWHEVVSHVMEIPDGLPSQIDAIWKKNRELATQNGEELIPQDFAEMFVDHNFPS